MNGAYATQISVEWNVPAYGVGYVSKFEADAAYLQKFKVENVGGEISSKGMCRCTILIAITSLIVEL